MLFMFDMRTIMYSIYCVMKRTHFSRRFSFDVLLLLRVFGCVLLYGYVLFFECSCVSGRPLRGQEEPFPRTV